MNYKLAYYLDQNPNTKNIPVKLRIPFISDLWDNLSDWFGDDITDAELQEIIDDWVFDPSPRSSNVEYVAYSEPLQTLQVRYKWGGVYRYYDIPEDTFRDFKRARSAGKWVWKNFRTPHDNVVDYELEDVKPSTYKGFKVKRIKGMENKMNNITPKTEHLIGIKSDLTIEEMEDTISVAKQFLSILETQKEYIKKYKKAWLGNNAGTLADNLSSYHDGLMEEVSNSAFAFEDMVYSNNKMIEFTDQIISALEEGISEI